MRKVLGSRTSLVVLFTTLVGILIAGALVAYAHGTPSSGPSSHCHVTDGMFTSCADGSQEWDDIAGTSFFDVLGGGVLSVLYVGQSDQDPTRSIPNGSGIDTLMLMYDEVQRTTPLGSSESVHVHFMTVDNLQLVHYDVFIGTGGLQKVLINDVEQVPMPSGVAGIAGFGPSPNNSANHVIAELQIGLEAAGFTTEECCYSPDPAWWGSSVPLPIDPKDPRCSGQRDGTVPDQKDECPTEEESTSAAVFTANLDGTTTVVPQPLLPPGQEPLLCESIGRIVDFRVPPTGTYKNHGDYVKKVAQLTEALVNSQVAAGLITEEEAEELQSCVVNPRARSDVGK